ncbi:MAG TPA: hypothetical protein VGK52_08930 [Polyangia bacterium]|jgi:hypothetical protein
MVCLAEILVCAVGCSPESYRGGLGATPLPSGAGGGSNPGGGGNPGITPILTGGAGDTGPGGAGTAGTGTGGGSAVAGSGGAGTAGTGGSGGSSAGAGSGAGSSGASPDASSDAAPTPDATARDAGAERQSDGAADAAPCVSGVQNLSNVGTGDFHVSFRVATTQTGWVALVNQRSTCYFGVFWDIRLCGAGGSCPQGAVSVETDDNPASSATYQTVHSTATVNDGKPHEVEASRVSGVVTIRIDGAVSGTGPSAASLGSMPALRIGTDVCGTANSPPTAAFAGTTLANVCITSP